MTVPSSVMSPPKDRTIHMGEDNMFRIAQNRDTFESEVRGRVHFDTETAT